MRSRRFLILVSVLTCAATFAFAACSSSPKSTGQKKRTVLLSEYDDARVGREASREVAAEIGILDSAKLNGYVSEIGRKLLRGLTRRSFQYEFAVVDQFEPNAFALPGGYVFISRGLLALANSEDELANVIGHEITHAARRHAAAQQEIARRGSPLAMPLLRAANIAAYGRDMERDADRGGQMLAAAAGYDPMGMSTFMNNLRQMERLLAGHTRVPTFLDTHPGSQERAATNAARSREIRWKRDPELGDTNASHLRQIEGLVLGPRPEGGIFEGDRFLHPDLDFHVRFPHGWRTSNTNRAVGAVSPHGDALVFLTADLPEGDPKEVAEAFLEKTMEQYRVDVKESKPVQIGRIRAWRIQLEGSSGRSSLVAYMSFIPYRGATWRITGVSPSHVSKQYLGRTLSTMRSFRPLTKEERRSIHATQLHIVTARPGEDLAALSRRTGNAWHPSRTAVLNGIFVNHRFEGGEPVKIAQVETYVAKPPTKGKPVAFSRDDG
jgi:predicted Zn-dependent protease